MSTEQYTLHYFDAPGRAEAIRMLLRYKKVAFDDKRYTREQWPKVKESLKPMYGQLPVLSLPSGEQICQSSAILLYCAREFGANGDNSAEKALCAQVAGGVEDLAFSWAHYNYRAAEADKPTLLKKLKEETLPFFLGVLEKQYQRFEGDFFLGSKMTYADACVGAFFANVMPKEEFKDYDFSKYPKCLKVYELLK